MIRNRLNIPGDKYFTEYLREEDIEGLSEFVQDLGGKLIDYGIPSLLYAVGSSTFSQEFWDSLAYDDHSHAVEGRNFTYSDIDLRVSRIYPVSLKGLKKATISSLEDMKMLYEIKEVTNMGHAIDYEGDIHYEGELPRIIPIQDPKIKSIVTKLENGTEIDLILDWDITMTAKKYLKDRKKENQRYSILFTPEGY